MGYQNPYRIESAAVPRGLTSARGFTLTEMAVVLVIVALLISSLVIPFSAQQDIRARQETEKILKDIQEALLGFAVAQGRLPCPATLASNGAEAPAGGGTCTCVSPDCFLPAATLGISPINSTGQAVDGWQNPIRYAVTSANANAFSTNNGMKNAWNGGLAPDLQVCATGACAIPLTNDAVAVIWSTGKNSFQGGTSADEIENPNPNTGANPDPTSRFVSRTSGDDFDDTVVWLSPNILYNRMITTGKLP